MNFTTLRFKDCITDIIDNRGRNPDKYYDLEKYPVIDNYLIKNELHPNVENVNRYLSQAQFDSFLRGYVTTDDLLMTLVGNGIGNVSLSPNDKIAIVQNTVGFRLNKDLLDSHFAFYYFRTINSAVRNLDRGASQPSVNRTDVLRLKLQLPDINTQKRIADILSTYDELIENNNKRIKLLGQLAENLYKEWFVRFRFPGYENTEFVEKRPFGWIVSACEKSKAPSCFDYCEFREIGSFVRGRNITAAEMVDGEIPVISAGLQPSGYHNQANVQGRSLTISASGANAGYLQYNLTDIWAADCSYYQNDKNLWFVYCTLKFLQPVINNLQCGAAQPHVYPKNINKLCVLKPTDELITKFNDTVEPFFKKIEILQKKNDSLVKQRDLLLPRIMSGKLEV